MAAHRTDGFIGAMSRIRNRGGLMGCKLNIYHDFFIDINWVDANVMYYLVYQGLLPWV